MSSSVHAKVNTIDRESLLKAAELLGVKLEQSSDNGLTWLGTKFKFDEKGNVDVKYYKDHIEENRKTKQLTQLGSYFTTSKRLELAGLKCTKSVNDVVLAVKANQKLTLEYEEMAEEQLAQVKA